MAFHSKYADRIWKCLYNCRIPDQLTLSRDFIRTRGTFTTDNKQVNQMLKTDLISVMIPVAKILEYFNSGIQVEIPSREDMIKIHKDIELYLKEWENHISYDINMDVNEHKELLLALERLSKHIYEKCHPSEVVENIHTILNIGLVNNMTKLELTNNTQNKPDYSGISQLIKSKTVRTRY